MFTIGEKVHVVIRRNMNEDLRHHFVGEVIDASDVSIRLIGYDFPFDVGTTFFNRREGIRTRIFSITDANNVISLLPIEAVIEDIKYKGEDGKRMVTDSKTFKYCISEFSPNR